MEPVMETAPESSVPEGQYSHPLISLFVSCICKFSPLSFDGFVDLGLNWVGFCVL